MSSLGSSRQDGSAGTWWKAHERSHDRRDAELDRRYHAAQANVDAKYQGLEERLRKVERAIYTLAGILTATTITAVINLVANIGQSQ